jgi:predicted nucleotidyltransferase
MTLNEKEKNDVVALLRKEIPSIQAIYLFGSQADRSADAESDVDIAFLTDETVSNVRRWEIAQKLAVLCLRDVDLIDLKTANTVLRFYVVATGERLYGKGYEVDLFETVSFSAYLRFKEERKAIVDAIIDDKCVFGADYA